MNTAIIVLTYNRPKALLAVLRSLQPQLGARDELWIADDGSNAANVELLRTGLQDGPGTLHHVWHPDIGFTASRARNMSAAQTQADYLLFLDGDCLVPPHWLAQHRALARAGCFVNGSRVLLSPGLTRRIEEDDLDVTRWGARPWLAARWAGDCNKLSHLLRFPGWPMRERARFSWKGIRSCNFGLWRSDFVAVNGFDESFQGWGHEDADLVLRLHNAGLMRRNGFWATEVLHLWHRENDRSREQSNRERVRARMGSALVQAPLGLAQAAQATDVRVQAWGRGQSK